MLMPSKRTRETSKSEPDDQPGKVTNPYSFPAVKYAVNLFYEEIAENGGGYDPHVEGFLLAKGGEGVNVGTKETDRRSKPLEKVLVALEEVVSERMGYNMEESYLGMIRYIGVPYADDYRPGRPRSWIRRLDCLHETEYVLLFIPVDVILPMAITLFGHEALKNPPATDQPLPDLSHIDTFKGMRAVIREEICQLLEGYTKKRVEGFLERLQMFTTALERKARIAIGKAKKELSSQYGVVPRDAGWFDAVFESLCNLNTLTLKYEAKVEPVIIFLGEQQNLMDALYEGKEIVARSTKAVTDSLQSDKFRCMLTHLVKHYTEKLREMIQIDNVKAPTPTTTMPKPRTLQAYANSYSAAVKIIRDTAQPLACAGIDQDTCEAKRVSNAKNAVDHFARLGVLDLFPEFDIKIRFGKFDKADLREA